LEDNERIDMVKFETAYFELLKNKDYEEAYKIRTSRTDKVRSRINEAIKAFKDIPRG